MKLYIYEHCPYCVKAWMIFGLKKHPIKIEVLLNDDEKTPISMIGQKMVPILERSPGDFMPESLDIIEYVDRLKDPELSWKESDKLLDFLDDNQHLCYELAMPRWVKMKLKEFKTKEARNYFQKKKEAYVGSFEKLLKDKSKIKDMEESLKDLEGLLKEGQFTFLKTLSVNDFHLFAFLRALSVVKGLKFPLKVKKYMEKMSKMSKVPLHDHLSL